MGTGGSHLKAWGHLLTGPQNPAEALSTGTLRRDVAREKPLVGRTLGVFTGSTQAFSLFILLTLTEYSSAGSPAGAWWVGTPAGGLGAACVCRASCPQKGCSPPLVCYWADWQGLLGLSTALLDGAEGHHRKAALLFPHWMKVLDLGICVANGAGKEAHQMGHGDLGLCPALSAAPPQRLYHCSQNGRRALGTQVHQVSDNYDSLRKRSCPGPQAAWWGWGPSSV